MIYFLLEPICGYIKIGFTSSVDPSGRITSLKGGTPFDYELLGMVEGDKEKEKEIHWKFRRFRYKGEWFSSHKNILNYINKYAKKIQYNKPQKYMDIIDQDNFRRKDKRTPMQKKRGITNTGQLLLFETKETLDFFNIDEMDKWIREEKELARRIWAPANKLLGLKG